MCFADLCFSCYSHYNPVETVGPRGVGRDRGWGGGIIIRHHTKYSDAHISDFYGGQKVIMWETRCFGFEDGSHTEVIPEPGTPRTGEMAVTSLFLGVRQKTWYLDLSTF